MHKSSKIIKKITGNLEKLPQNDIFDENPVIFRFKDGKNGKNKASAALKIAESAQQREIGLSRTEKLPPFGGMFFTKSGSFWMPPEMKFPLDIVFVKHDGEILEKKAMPRDNGKYRYFATKSGSAHAIELPFGFCDKYGIKAGDYAIPVDNIFSNTEKRAQAEVNPVYTANKFGTRRATMYPPEPSSDFLTDSPDEQATVNTPSRQISQNSIPRSTVQNTGTAGIPNPTRPVSQPQPKPGTPASPATPGTSQTSPATGASVDQRQRAALKNVYGNAGAQQILKQQQWLKSLDPAKKRQFLGQYKDKWDTMTPEQKRQALGDFYKSESSAQRQQVHQKMDDQIKILNGDDGDLPAIDVNGNNYMDLTHYGENKLNKPQNVGGVATYFDPRTGKVVSTTGNQYNEAQRQKQQRADAQAAQARQMARGWGSGITQSMSSTPSTPQWARESMGGSRPGQSSGQTSRQNNMSAASNSRLVNNERGFAGPRRW